MCLVELLPIAEATSSVPVKRNWSGDNILLASPRQCAKQFGSTDMQIGGGGGGLLSQAPCGPLSWALPLYAFQFSSPEAVEGLTYTAFHMSWKNETSLAELPAPVTAEIQISLRQSSPDNTLDHVTTQPLLQLIRSHPAESMYSGLYGFPAHTVGWLTAGRVMDEVSWACVWQGLEAAPPIWFL